MRCRSTARNGAAWALPAAASPPATARSAACRSTRRTMSTATSNIICPMSAMACRYRVRERGHEERHAQNRAAAFALDRGRNLGKGGRIRGRFQGGVCRGRSRQQGGGLAAQSMDHHGGDAGGGKEGGRCRRVRQGNRVGQGSRSIGKSLDLPGHQRKGALEGHGNSLRAWKFAKGLEIR